MNCTEEIVQLTNDMQKEVDEFGEVTFETKQRLKEILKDENKRFEFRKYYQNRTYDDDGFSISHFLVIY